MNFIHLDEKFAQSKILIMVFLFKGKFIKCQEIMCAGVWIPLLEVRRFNLGPEVGKKYFQIKH